MHGAVLEHSGGRFNAVVGASSRRWVFLRNARRIIAAQGFQRGAGRFAATPGISPPRNRKLHNCKANMVARTGTAHRLCGKRHPRRIA